MTIADLDPLAAADDAWSRYTRHPTATAIPLPDTDIAALLDIHAWAKLDIPPEPQLLGALITPSSRIFIAGHTGLGKTLLAHAMGAGMASGQGFLHWRSDRPSRWLIIDGEMPTALIKARASDLIRRTGPIPPGNLVVYCIDRAEEFARLIPGLGLLEPINTQAGQQFVLRLAEAVGAEGIIFDNVMSLITGDQKDEVPWSETLPLVTALSKRKIAQIYLDHTGHNTGRQYGSATKAWRMDAVGMMTALPDDQRERGEVAFSLCFEPPGKARRRTPDNWQDFETSTIRLTDDRWTSELTKRPATGKSPSPKAEAFYRALLDALSRGGREMRHGRPTCTLAEWQSECGRLGLINTDGKSNGVRALLSKYRLELVASGWMACEDGVCWSLR